MSRRGWALTIFGVVIVLFVITAVVSDTEWTTAGKAGHWEERWIEGQGEKKIVQLFVEGTIAEEAGVLNGFSGREFIRQLDQAIDDPDVAGIVLRVNSPGGGVVISDEIYRKILEVKEQDKVVTVSMGAIAASGGYYISAPADYIYANPGTFTGSLGVIIRTSNYQELANKIGYKEYVFKSGEMKDIGNPLRQMSDEEAKVFQSIVDESYQRFVDIIVKGRDLSREHVLEIADGRIYSGRQARELGLVDEMGSLEDATDKALELAGLEEARIIRYEEGFSFSGLWARASRPKQQSYLETAVHELLKEMKATPQLLYLYRP